MPSERGQSTVEWVGILLVLSLLLAAAVAAGVRVPGAALAQSIASRILCATAMVDGCGDEPVLVAAYGTEVGQLVREHMPSIDFESGSRGLPVDFRRCRRTSCGDGPQDGDVRRSDSGLPVTAFVHVVDCRPDAAARTESHGADCSGDRAGNLYIEYFTYYADSATLRDIPYVGSRGYHEDDWEGVEIRMGPNGDVDERASSHDGYNYSESPANWGSDAGIGPLKAAAEAIGLRADNGWGPETHRLHVSGGSHAGNADGYSWSDRDTPAHDVHLVPLESILAEVEGTGFAISPPWRKRLWSDPEADGTD
jgi:hypothetical protein